MSITTFNQTGSPLQILETSLAPNSSTSISLDSSRQLVIDGITVQLGNFERGFIEKERFWIYQELTDQVVILTVLVARGLSNWVSSLPDSHNLLNLTLPGTHESLALQGFPHSTCQTLSTLDQLRAGVRAFDYRFSLVPNQAKTGNELKGYHGIIDQNIFAQDAFKALYEFLDGDGRGETIFLSIKQENGEQGFEEAVFALIEQNLSKWYLEARWPNLGEVRGKIVLFCRFQHREVDGGLHTPLWPDSSGQFWNTSVGNQELTVQDWYSISGMSDIPTKAALVLSMFEENNSKQGAINFSSAASLPVLFPIVVAQGVGFDFSIFSTKMKVKGVNEIVLEELLKKKRAGRLNGKGMLLMTDYAARDFGLVQILISRNF